MLVDIRVASKMLKMPIGSLRAGLSGLTEYRTKGKHRRYELAELVKLAKIIEQGKILTNAK